MRKLLHVGCGPATKLQTIPFFIGDEWAEIRYDIDPSVCPDIEGSLTNMERIESGSVDAIFSSHNIEHLFYHEVPVALREFNRVLKPDGFVVIACPDIKLVCKIASEKGLHSVAYEVPGAKISAHDILYGWGLKLAEGQHYMAHKCGLDEETLLKQLVMAGFGDCQAFVDTRMLVLWAVARKSCSDLPIEDFAKSVLVGLV